MLQYFYEGEVIFVGRRGEGYSTFLLWSLDGIWDLHRIIPVPICSGSVYIYIPGWRETLLEYFAQKHNAIASARTQTQITWSRVQSAKLLLGLTASPSIPSSMAQLLTFLARSTKKVIFLIPTWCISVPVFRWPEMSTGFITESQCGGLVTSSCCESWICRKWLV